MVEWDLATLLDSILTGLGLMVVSTGDAIVEAIKQMTSNPRALAREIIIQVIMFGITTIVLGGLYHRFVLVPQAQKAESRRTAMLQPFRRMLVTRIANTHARLLLEMSENAKLTGHWRRPSLRAIRTAIAGLNADFGAAILTNQDILETDEQLVVGKYSELLFNLQSQLDLLEQNVHALTAAHVTEFHQSLVAVDACVEEIAAAFDGEYAPQIRDLRWNADDWRQIELSILQPLSTRAATLAAKGAASDPVDQAIATSFGVEEGSQLLPDNSKQTAPLSARLKELLLPTSKSVLTSTV